MAHNIDSIKTGSVGKKWGFSGTHRTSYILKKSNVYPHQSKNYFAHFAMRYPALSSGYIFNIIKRHNFFDRWFFGEIENFTIYF